MVGLSGEHTNAKLTESVCPSILIASGN